MHDYSFFYYIGFWFILGTCTGLAVAALIAAACRYVVEACISKYKEKKGGV